MDTNYLNAYNELKQAFANLDVEDKRDVVVDQINDIAQLINKIKPSDDIDPVKPTYNTEEEYLCYLNSALHNLQNKIQKLFEDALH